MKSFAKKELVHYIDFAQYDETPMNTTVAKVALPLAHARTSTGLEDLGQPVQNSMSLSIELGDTSILTKILQTRQNFCLLMKRGESS